jgi:hypothetical protein
VITEDMKYCCSMFQDLLELAGRRGQSVVVIDGGVTRKRYAFLFQARATDADQPCTEVTTYPVATVMTMEIEYCPCCGKNLDRFYARASLPVHPELADAWDEAHHRC